MYNNLTDLDQHCIDNAVLFTAIRGRNPMTRTRMEFSSLEEAKEYASGFSDRRTMIYAVTKQGRSAPILSC